MRTAESLIKTIGDSPLPPVDMWKPAYCGELDLIIKADGTWVYNSTPIQRRRIQLLFSRVIKKEGVNYFLVTPYEKLGIQVEWCPFTIIDFDVIQLKGLSTFRLTDSCNNQILLTRKKQLFLREYQGVVLPIVNIRSNLSASFSRSCYYRIVEHARTVEVAGYNKALIESNGVDLCLGKFKTN